MFTVSQLSGERVQVRSTSSSSGTNTNEITVTFAPNVDAVIRRGTTDTDITAIALRNASGQQVFIYPNASANGVTVSTTAP